MDTPISIGARLTQLAAERPDLPAVSDDHRTVTWRELDLRTNRIARGLEAAGVKLGIGTDLTFGLYRNLPGPYIQELHNFETLGYSPVEALVIATKTNSEILGMSDRLGTVETGKLADLIFVDGKPDQSVDDLRRIEMVIVNGRVIVRDGRLYIPRHREETLTMPASMH